MVAPNPIPAPPQIRTLTTPSPPNDPPTDTDVALAYLFEHDAMHHRRLDGGIYVSQDQLIDVIKYKNAVLVAAAAANPVALQVAPPWFANAMAASLEPIRNDIATLKADIATLKADIATLKADVAILKADVTTLKEDNGAIKDGIDSIEERQIKMHKTAVLLRNASLGLGTGTPFEEVPFEDGTYPWNTIYKRQTLPPLTNVNEVKELTGYKLRGYFVGYFPNVEVPRSRKNRRKAVLQAIGYIGN
ncbi:uncharacterized protein FIBRA_07727 [Fibroporia radiculosa]|uniref:Mug135-like C-terminal domain-containing protein n=1 Tax=Fibroporia radiculosa TaxID=599839 RepID=J4H4S6_9APHY|nr:uncharacterized protein FIBRA_07727 [Fibroporia radiculosa]CCM05504.1 predicted protein [Fibroporia radiculosa]